MTNPVCPKTGAPMHRAARPMTLDYKGLQMTFDMPGWYCAESDESIHTGEDMKVSDRALNRLKGETEGLPSPDAGTGGRADRWRPARVSKIRGGRPVAEPRGRQRPRSARSRPVRPVGSASPAPRRSSRAVVQRSSRGRLIPRQIKGTGKGCDFNAPSPFHMS